MPGFIINGVNPVIVSADPFAMTRVVYRLQRWEGIQMEVPNYSGKSNGPHNRWLCEGCKAGHCEDKS